MSEPIKAEQYLAQMNWRYAVKEFDGSKAVPQESFDAIMEAVRLSPSSFGFQPWRFIVVESDEMKKALGEAAPNNQAKIVDASHLLVFTHLKTVSQEYIDNYVESMKTQRNQSDEDVADFHKMVSGMIPSMPKEAQEAWTAKQT